MSHLPSKHLEAAAAAQRGGKFNSLCSSVTKVRTFKTSFLLKFPFSYKTTVENAEKKMTKFMIIISEDFSLFLCNGPSLCLEDNSINVGGLAV